MTNCTDSQNSILEVFNIGKRYKNRSVLRNVSLNVRRGEAVGLLGPNGAGKTTCFYCVTGLITPDYGDVHIDGQDITYMPMYKRARMGIGYLPQEASIFRNLSVEDNIKAVLEIVVDDKEKREVMLEELLNEFPLPICENLRLLLCPAAKDAGLKLPVHWPGSRIIFFSTSRWPELTRLPSVKYVNLFHS